MRRYFALFKMRLIAGMQYRAAAWAGIVTQLFWGFMYIMIYQAFYASSSAAPPMEWGQLVSYLWLQQSFLAIIMLWRQDGDLLQNIENGNVAYELCRPYDIFSFWYVRILAMRLSAVLLRCLPILLVAFLLPCSYRLSLPASPASAVLFFISLILSLFLISAISMFIYILTFKTLSQIGSRLIIAIAAEFLQGGVIPIPMMPPWLQRLMDFLPFRYTADLPFRIYSGNIGAADALLQLGITLLWIAGLLILGVWVLRRFLRRVVVQGG